MTSASATVRLAARPGPPWKVRRGNAVTTQPTTNASNPVTATKAIRSSELVTELSE